MNWEVNCWIYGTEARVKPKKPHDTSQYPAVSLSKIVDLIIFIIN